jgi:cyclohexanone monooxygenase
LQLGITEGGRLTATHKWPRVAIIGAGPGGLACARSLRAAGFTNFTIYERSDGVGGVWRQNTYPGAACDGKSHFYSFSWAINPAWSEAFANQSEILSYFENIAAEHGLIRHLSANTRIVGVTWNDAQREWYIESADGRVFCADIVISAIGLFNEPQLPAIAGLEDFSGVAFHSAVWNHEHKLSGKHIAVIGTGASAVQFVPKVAPLSARTYVFQRQPGWVLPKQNPPYSSRQRWIFRHVPGAARLHRLHIWFVMERDVQIKIDSRMQRKQRRIALQHLLRSVSDPELRARLTPNYPVGCTRRLLSDEWFPTLQAPNVELVTDQITRITKDGVETSDGKLREVDTICFATGFRRGYLSNIEVIGLGSVRLQDMWSAGATAHFGLTVPGFPNFFLIYGPYTNGVTPITHVIEAQARYITMILKRMRRRGRSLVDVKPSSLQHYDVHMQRALIGSVWAGGCGSYFLDADGKVRTQYPHRFLRYWLMTWRVRVRDYRWA